MDEAQTHPALRRILKDHADDPLFDALAHRLSGTDLTTLLMAVAQTRAARRTPADVLGQYERDRFVRPGTVDARRLLDIEHLALQEAGRDFEPVRTSPVLPLGAHSVVAGVSQNRLVSTSRGSEVAADPTMSLALEAAVRRRGLLAGDPRSQAVVRLAAVERVLRAQQPTGARSFAHFGVLGLVSAGRDAGSHAFEIAELRRHIATLAAVVQRLGLAVDRVLVSDVSGTWPGPLEQVMTELRDEGLRAEAWSDRTAGTGYYTDLCFKVSLRSGDELIEIGDGGAVTWTATLLGNAKERQVISGLGLDRLVPEASPPPERQEDRRPT